MTRQEQATALLNQFTALQVRTRKVFRRLEKLINDSCTDIELDIHSSKEYGAQIYEHATEYTEDCAIHLNALLGLIEEHGYISRQIFYTATEQTTSEFFKITEEMFDADFACQQNHIEQTAPFDGQMFETFGAELKHVQEMAKLDRVITITEGDDDSLCYQTGMRLVNRIGYLILTEPYTYQFVVELETAG